MSTPKVTRKVYSAEELHQLRYTQSQPKLREAIEEHDSEDAEIVKATSMSSPSPFELHRRWIEELIATPEDDKFAHRTANITLTSDVSPSEHILRGSKSFAARSFRSRTSTNSLRVPSTKSNNENLSAFQEPVRQPLGVPSHVGGGVLGEIAPNGQMLRSGPFKFGPSPTPSMKKKKAEAIVKAHGSPTHVRVTAGGRIVPSEQSPLCHPRYGYSAIKTNGGLIKFAPNHHAGKPQWTRATEDGFVAQDMHGNLCQIVNGTILPLNEVDGALRLYMPAPNLNVTQPGSSLGAANAVTAAPPTQAPSVPPSMHTQASEPPVASQITALELEYSKLEHELKDVDKTEVIHGRTMGKVAKDALISKRRELIVGMDKIRKALKELKNRPPPNAPTSPRAMLSKQSASPSRGRLPPFLQMQPVNNAMQAPPVLPAYNTYFPAPGAVSQYAVQPTPSPEEIYVGQSWTIPPASMFLAPPPFDGSVASPFAAVPTSVLAGAAVPQEATLGTAVNLAQGIPQNDGALSSMERHNTSPNRSRAVSIRAPEPRPAAAVKSCLNPMSPVYKPAFGPTKAAVGTSGNAAKPVKDRVPTPLSPLRQLQPPIQSHKASTPTDETISPSKKTAHLHSSSISSFETADFFPRNTREYSTRQHAYSFQNEHIEDKENSHPDQAEHSPFTPDQHSLAASSVPQGFVGRTPHAAGFPPTAAPPGTPVHPLSISSQTRVQSGPQIDVPNREADNVSPKSKREWLFVQEHPEQPSAQPSKNLTSTDKVSGTVETSNIIDFSQKPREWIEGYQAGLHRKPISADRMDKFLDGYCAGLLKSKAANETTSTSAPSTSSPMKPASRRPSPNPPSRTSSRLPVAEKAPAPMTYRQPLESRVESLDTLKQAVFAPHNENAVLTPAVDGPHISDMSLNLGAWGKAQQGVTKPLIPTANQQYHNESGYFVPNRMASTVPRQAVTSEDRAELRHKGKALPPEPRRVVDSAGACLQPGGHASDFMDSLTADPGSGSPSLSNRSLVPSSIASGSAPNTGNRVTSITSIDASIYRQWPGSRIMTPTEWKSGSSVAHAAGLATGYFASTQYDGATQMQRVGSVTSATTTADRHGRFREGSLDGLTNPATSPSGPISPGMSPHDTPIKEAAKRKDSGPRKGPSPTKAKFEHIAGKVGIKVTAAPKTHDTLGGSFEPGSPPDKRRWRDVWRKGGRDGNE